MTQDKIEASSPRIEWMDTLRALAVIAVVQIHLCSPVVKMAFNRQDFDWWTGNIVDSGLRFAVPLFLVLSGATMLEKEYKSYGYFIKRRFMRVFLPFIFWWLAYLPFSWLTIHPAPHANCLPDVLRWIGALFMEKGISTHFWYIYMLIFLYPFIPPLGKWARNAKPHTVDALLLAWVLVNIIFYNDFHWFSSQSFILGKAMLYLRYMGFLLLGYRLNQFSYSPKKKLTAALLYACTVAVVSVMTTKAFGASAKAQPFYGYLCWTSILQTTCVFVIFSGTTIKCKSINKLLHTISDYSYGIYLVHIMPIGILFINGVYWEIAPTPISLPLLETIVIASSLTILFLLRQIPKIGNYIAG